MSLADEVAELRRRVADMVRRGVVEEVIPGSPVMVRVDSGEVSGAGHVVFGPGGIRSGV